MPEIELKACPFCGGEAEMSYCMKGDNKAVAGFYVECGSCSAGGEPFDIQGEAPDREEYTKSKAVAAWNTRPTPDLGEGELDRLVQEWDATESFTAESLYLFVEALVGAARAALSQVR